MLLRLHLHSDQLSNNSAMSGFNWEEFDFEMCNSFTGSKYVWVSLTLLCFAFGFPASIVILWEMFKMYKRGTPLTPNNFFMLNLSTMDVVFLAFIPPGIVNHLSWKCWEMEAIWNFVYALNICGRPLLMACICLDCFLAVVHPIAYHKKKSLTPRVVMAVIVWIWTVATGIVYCLFYKLYFTMFYTWPFIVAIIIIGICDSFILHTLVKSDPGRKTIHPQKQRAIQTLINSLLMTVFSYLPPLLLLLIGKHLFIFDVYVCVVGIPITITSSLGSAIMPILYLNNIGKLNCLKRGCCRMS